MMRWLVAVLALYAGYVAGLNVEAARQRAVAVRLAHPQPLQFTKADKLPYRGGGQ